MFEILNHDTDYINTNQLYDLREINNIWFDNYLSECEQVIAI